MEFLVVCPLVFLAGFVDAIAGGGGLISLPAYLIAGLPAHYAIGTNKMSSSMGTAVATWNYWKNGYIKWKLAIGCALLALVGSNIGARMGLLLDEQIFRIVLLIILPVTAIYLLFRKNLGSSEDEQLTAKTYVLCMLIAGLIGMYDGFYGPGTGTFLILLLTGVAHMRLDHANGVTKVINLTSNLSALVVLLAHDRVMLLLGIVAGCCNIAGNYLGSKCFVKGGLKIVKPMIFAVIAIFFIKTMVEML